MSPLLRKDRRSFVLLSHMVGEPRFPVYCYSKVCASVMVLRGFLLVIGFMWCDFSGLIVFCFCVFWVVQNLSCGYSCTRMAHFDPVLSLWWIICRHSRAMLPVFSCDFFSFGGEILRSVNEWLYLFVLPILFCIAACVAELFLDGILHHPVCR